MASAAAAGVGRPPFRTSGTVLQFGYNRSPQRKGEEINTDLLCDRGGNQHRQMFNRLSSSSSILCCSASNVDIRCCSACSAGERGENCCARGCKWPIGAGNTAVEAANEPVSPKTRVLPTTATVRRIERM